jgi:ABC-type sugar transport system permease subunit
MNTKLNSFIKHFKFHLGIVLRGLGRTLHGAFITGLIALAVYGFVLIKTEGGYAAVFDFVAAIAVLVIALCNVYLLGNKRKGGKK